MPESGDQSLDVGRVVGIEAGCGSCDDPLGSVGDRVGDGAIEQFEVVSGDEIPFGAPTRTPEVDG